MTERRLVAYCRPEDEARARRHLEQRAHRHPGTATAELRTSGLVPPGQVIVVDEAAPDDPAAVDLTEPGEPLK